MGKRSFWITPANELSPIQVGPFIGVMGIMGLVFGAAIGFVVIEHMAYSAFDLAEQVANGTHEIRWDTNEFGTREVRIVEITDDTTE